jgi:hypothetical protein
LERTYWHNRTRCHATAAFQFVVWVDEITTSGCRRNVRIPRTDTMLFMVLKDTLICSTAITTLVHLFKKRHYKYHKAVSLQSGCLRATDGWGFDSLRWQENLYSSPFPDRHSDSWSRKNKKRRGRVVRKATSIARGENGKFYRSWGSPTTKGTSGISLQRKSNWEWSLSTHLDAKAQITNTLTNQPINQRTQRSRILLGKVKVPHQVKKFQ